MLDALRRGSAGWLAKALFGILVLAFAVWGIPHNFLSFGGTYVAKVGNQEITPEDFQQSYQNQLQMLAQYGRRFTPEQARALGFDTRVLSGLIDTAAVDQHARELNLGVSDQTVAEQIARLPNFRGPDGKFDKKLFDGYLRQIRMSEQGFLAQRRQDEVREQLLGSLLEAVAPPDAIVDALHAYREEKRKFAFVTIPEAAIKVAEPDDAKLKETYEQNKRQFVIPETRKLGILLLPLADIKARAAVSDAEVRAYFDKNREGLNIPERRRVQTITFKDKAAAEAGLKAIAGGKSFMMLALETEGAGGQLPNLMTRSELGDPKLGEAAFSLPKDQLSGIIETGSGPTIALVTEIAPRRERSFDEVKEEVRTRLTEEKAATETKSVQEDIDNARANRKPLKDTAAQLKLTYLEVTSDSRGMGPDGKPALDHPDAAKLIEHGFQGAMNVETDLVDLADGGSAWVDTLAVTKEVQKPLESVKEDVKAVYMESARRRVLSEMSAKFVERVNAGEALEAIATEIGGKVETTAGVTRTTVPQGLSEAAMQIGFATAQSTAASAESADRKSRTVIKVLGISAPPPPTKEQADRIRAELARQLQGDVRSAYAAAVRDRAGVAINEVNFRRATGAERP